MKRLLLAIIVCLVLAASVGAIALASDTFDALYRGTVRVSNNSTATTGVAVPFTASSADYIAGGFMNTSANNTAITRTGVDIAYMPGFGDSNPWVVFVNSIGANTIQDNTLFMGGATDMAAKIRYSPGAGGMTVADTAALEPGDTFTASISGFIDTDNNTDKNIVNKTDALSLFVSPTVSGNISLSIGDAENLLNYTEDDVNNKLTVTPARATGADVDRDEDVFLWTDKGADFYDTVNIEFEIFINSSSANGAFGALAIVNTIQDRASFGTTEISVDIQDTGAAYTLELVRGNGTATDAYTPAADTPYYCSLTRPASGNVTTLAIYTDTARTVLVDTLTVAGFGSTKYRYLMAFVNLNAPSAGDNFDGYIGDIVDFGDSRKPTYLSATGISSGEYDISVGAANQSSVWSTGDVLHFDGTINSNIDCGVSYNASANLWVSMWFKLDTAHATGTGNQWLFSKRADGSNVIWLRLDSAAGKMRGTMDIGGAGKFNVFSTETTWAADTWHHVIFSTSSANGVRLIVNGGTAVTHTDNTSLPDGGAILLGNITTPGTEGLIGELQNVVIGTDDLTGAEEIALYNFTMPGDETDLWFIDEGTGTTITSYGSAANPGTAGAATSWEVSTFTTGQTGRLYSLAFRVGSNYAGSQVLFLYNIDVPDTSANWTFAENDSMLYMETANLTIGGVLQGSWEWEYAATFTDLSGQGHDATPSFRTTSSDADVSAELVSFGPDEEARAPAFSVNITTSGWITQDLTTTGNFTTTTNSTYPGSIVVSDITTAGDTPIQLFELIMAGVIMLGLSFGVSAMMRRSREGSLFFKILVIAAGLGVLIAVSVVDNWILYLFLMIAIALVMASSQRQFTGTGNSGNNMIGFLAMSFVGMTTINRILEGRFIQSADVSILRNTLAFQPFEVFGLFTIPVPNTGFLLNGIPALLRWDYSFFGGNAQIFQYLLYSVTAVVSFMLFILVFGAIYQMFSRGR